MDITLTDSNILSTKIGPHPRFDFNLSSSELLMDNKSAGVLTPISDSVLALFLPIFLTWTNCNKSSLQPALTLALVSSSIPANSATYPRCSSANTSSRSKTSLAANNNQAIKSVRETRDVASKEVADEHRLDKLAEEESKIGKTKTKTVQDEVEKVLKRTERKAEEDEAEDDDEDDDDDGDDDDDDLSLIHI